MIPTRGERNNNPGNIEKNPLNGWQGLAANQCKDIRFCTFTEPLWGIRAIARVLLSYEKMYKAGTPQDIDTVAEVINKWAPPTENNTESYIEACCRSIGVEATQFLNLRDHDILAKLVTEIIRHENGRVIYSTLLISNAVTMALS